MTFEATKPICEWEMHGYPHPGAAEFGPPDVFTCDRVADTAITVTGPWGPVVILTCPEHGRDMATDPEVVGVRLIDAEWLTGWRDGAIQGLMLGLTMSLVDQFHYDMVEGTVLEAPLMDGSDWRQEAFCHGWCAALSQRCSDVTDLATAEQENSVERHPSGWGG